MDLGCLDLGCISVLDKHNPDATITDSNNNERDSGERVSSASKVGKNKSPRGSGQSTWNALNKFTSQIKKPPHRKTSPLNWFPRKKVDSYLKRKIKMLQEVDGMNLTLDETLGDSNLHYSKVLREKIAAREAAHKAMEARKSALVEASWCRILQAARIQCKEAEAQLLQAEKAAAEAFEAATALGVIMYDAPNGPRKPCKVETSTVDGGKSTTHTVTASFETAFEVDKEVAAAVKSAFVRLASCPSFDKDEFKDLLRKISQNPDVGDTNLDLPELSSEFESESGSEPEMVPQNNGFGSQDMDCGLPIFYQRQKKYKSRPSLEKVNALKLVDMMLERLRRLKEDELSSLATIVATCGLNAALAEVGSSKLVDPGSATEYTSGLPPNFPRRMSSVGARTMRSNVTDGQMRRKQAESDLPSLDKFLVKHMTKLEREVQEAKNRRRNESSTEGNQEDTDKTVVGITSPRTVPDLGSILVKNSSKFEKEIEEAKRNSGKDFEIGKKKLVPTSSEAIPDLGSTVVKHSSKLENEVQETRKNFGKAPDMNDKEHERGSRGMISQKKQDVPEVPSLDQILVKHVSRLEKEVREAKNRRKNEPVEKGRVTNVKKKVDSSNDGEVLIEKENVDLNKEEDRNSEMLPLKHEGDSHLAQEMKDGNNETEVKPMQTSLESNYGNRRQNKNGGRYTTDCESLDKVLVKHVSRLEKEKMELRMKEEEVKVKVKVKRSGRNVQLQVNEEGGLDQILVKHKSRLEREMMAYAQQPGDQTRLSVSRREARERELQEAWGGLSLGDSVKPHLSKLERDKAAWIKAEEEERKQAMVEE